MNLVKMITLKNDKIICENGNKKGLRIKKKKKKILPLFTICIIICQKKLKFKAISTKINNSLKLIPQLELNISI